MFLTFTFLINTLNTMLLCAFAITLLAIVAGMMLLAQTKKENLGNIYKYVSWFVIIMAFLSELCIGARCAMRCHGGGCMMTKECRMMDDDGCMMGGGMMGCHRGMMMGGCGMMGGCNMMMGGGCCGGMMMNGCCAHMGCNEGMSECHEGMGSCHEGSCCQQGGNECHEGMGECKEGMQGGSCPMMKGEMHGMMKDSTKKK